MSIWRSSDIPLSSLDHEKGGVIRRRRLQWFTRAGSHHMDAGGDEEEQRIRILPLGHLTLFQEG